MLAVKQEPYVRAGVVNSAINIYIALDDWERARDLLALEATTSNTPHYYIGDLADVEEHLGNKQRSVELLAEAYAKAKGPASRFQWGYQYLDGLLRLTPDDLATIEKVGLQVIAELDGPNRIHRRTLVAPEQARREAARMEYTSSARWRNRAWRREAASHACQQHRGDCRQLLFVRARPARVGARRGADRAPALGQRLAQQPLDLTVDAAQLLGRHRLDRGGDRRIEAQQEGLS